MTEVQTATQTALVPDEVTPPAGQVSGSVPALLDETGNALALVQDDPWSDVGDGDLVPDSATTAGIPRLAVNRKSDGGFVDESTGEVFRTLDFVWMARSQTRAWWPEAFGKGDDAPACRSNDGLTPEANSPAQQDEWEPPVDQKTKQPITVKPAKTCAECPHSRWNGDEPPSCALALEAMIGVPNFDEHAVELYRLRFSGMGYGPARRYWETFSARLPKRPPIAFVSRVTLEPEQTDNGVFLRPKFERLYELTREQAAPIINERDRRIGEWQEIVATETPVDDDLSAGPTSDRDAPADYDTEPF